MRKIIMRAKRLLLLLALTAPALGACSANQYAGINMAEASFNETGTPKQILFVGGKESGKVTLEVNLKDGTAKFEGEDIRAFEGQAIRAALEAEFARASVDIAPELLQAIIDAIVGL